MTDAITAAAKAADVDIDQMRRDMDSKDTTAIIARTRAAAARLDQWYGVCDRRTRSFRARDQNHCKLSLMPCAQKVVEEVARR